MTIKTIEMAKAFIGGTSVADDFVNAYINQWYDMSAEELTSEGVGPDRASSDIFMLADIYNPAPDREEYEIDENQLREKIKEILAKFNIQ